MEGGRWTGQKFEWTPFQSLRCRLRVHEYGGRESPRKTLMSSEPRLDAQVANREKIRLKPEVNPKRRLLMKSASLTASGSGQRKDESIMQVEDTSETVTGHGASIACSTVGGKLL